MSAQVESVFQPIPQPTHATNNATYDLTNDDLRSLKSRIENLVRRSFTFFDLRDKVSRFARDGLHLNVKLDVGNEHIHVRLLKQLNTTGTNSLVDLLIKHIKVGQTPDAPLDPINDILE